MLFLSSIVLWASLSPHPQRVWPARLVNKLYPPIYLSVHLPIYISGLSVYLSIYLSTYLSISLGTRPFARRVWFRDYLSICYRTIYMPEVVSFRLVWNRIHNKKDLTSRFARLATLLPCGSGPARLPIPTYVHQYLDQYSSQTSVGTLCMQLAHTANTAHRRSHN